MMREKLFELAEQAGFKRVKACCEGVPFKVCSTDEWRGDIGALAAKIERHTREAILAEVRSRLFQQFTEQEFWHAHHVDLVWRYNGQDVHEEADWLKDVWYSLRGKRPGAA